MVTTVEYEQVQTVGSQNQKDFQIYALVASNATHDASKTDRQLRAQNAVIKLIEIGIRSPWAVTRTFLSVEQRKQRLAAHHRTDVGL
jgi:hypothetical protein